MVRRRSAFKVTASSAKPALAVKRSKPKLQKRFLEHVAYGHGNLRYIRPLDDGSYAAVVDFSGIERTIRLAPAFWIGDIAEVLKLARHLAPPAPKPVAEKKTKA